MTQQDTRTEVSSYLVSVNTPDPLFDSVLSSLQVMVHRTPFHWVSLSSILSVRVSLAKPLIRLIASMAGGLAVF